MEFFPLLNEMACRWRQCFPREGQGRIYSAISELEKSTPLCTSSLIKNTFQSETSLLLAKVELIIDWLIFTAFGRKVISYYIHWL